MKRIRTIGGKNILFLQGPMGTFFKKLDISFRAHGARTFRIGFNTGDWVFSTKDNYTPYKGKQEDWGQFIYNYLIKNKIDKILLFGDCRFYQRICLQVANDLNISIFVFEEGYVRPNFITMEEHGVNDFSHIPRDISFYKKLNVDEFKNKSILDTKPNQYKKIFEISIYFILKDLLWFKYPHYEHHTKYNFLEEFFFAIRNLYRKSKYKLTEKKLSKEITTKYHKKYYFVPLQTYNDFQILEHSDFSSIEAFIKYIMISFAKHAPKNTFLLLKHHPMDRGRKEYSKFITTLSKELNITQRVIISHDLHLPTALKNTIATVTINSTVGISSLYHETPTIVLGNAIYDIDKITCKNMALDIFWNNYIKPNKELFQKFRLFLIETTQLNGSFYGRLPDEL
ncbi:MAG: capsular biosynthesis protein [Sulfurovum sp.]|nr:capsular biosynthesis protein [Sulfurovum sp.]